VIRHSGVTTTPLRMDHVVDLETAAAIAALVTFVLAALALGYRAIRRADRVLTAVENIQRDLRPNGGSSFADTIDGKFAEMNGRITEVSHAARTAADIAARSEAVTNIDRGQIRNSLRTLVDTSKTTSTLLATTSTLLATHLGDAARDKTEILARLGAVEDRRSA
jgi:hypothetical protein